MQDAGEDSALDGELKTAVLQELAQDCGNAEPLPQPSKQQRPAKMRVQAMPARLQIGHHNGAIAMPHQRGGQTIEFTARQQHVLAAERG
jgi:hypothetical protein